MVMETSYFVFSTCSVLSPSPNIFLFGRTGFELRASNLQSRCSTASASPPVFLLTFFEQDTEHMFYFDILLKLNYSRPTLF
jgi:hypothetical protein